MDVYGALMGGELQYINIAAGKSVQTMAAYQSWSNHNAFYVHYVHNCENVFGCIGLRHKKYCVLNQQYTKEEYEALVPKIIEHMRKTKEWGEFFPLAISPLAYNESHVYSYFPLSKECVLERGWRWVDDVEPKVRESEPTDAIPDDVHDATDDIARRIFRCDATGKPFKVIPEELTFVRSMNIALPRVSPEQRYRTRMARRNPRKLWLRECAHCKKTINTTYASDRPEIVYCEECYLRAVY
jgi:hypothetical protein